MPPKADREERRLQRQRGAGRREVKNTAGFELVLPEQDRAPLEPRKSGRNRKTPQPEAQDDAPLEPRKSGRSRKTPQTEPLPPQQSSRRTPALETLPPQRPTRRTPAYDAPLPPQRSTRRTPAPEPPLPPQRSTKRTPAPALATTGKRKRPTGEATFDFPESPAHPSDVHFALNAVDEQPTKKQRVEDEVDENVDVEQPDVEEEAEPAGVLGAGKAHGGALQKGGSKKRKKRKSIGQQKPKRASAGADKVTASSSRFEKAQDVKAEPLSSPAQPGNSSRLHEFLAEEEDPAGAQIQEEFAGAMEAGLRDSLVGDGVEEEVKSKLLKGERKIFGQPGSKTGKAASRKMPLPESKPAAGHGAHAGEGAEEDEEQDEEDEDAEDEEGYEEQGAQVQRRAPTAQMLPAHPKPKRKKRKSIGQQKPKRRSSGSTQESPNSTTTLAPGRRTKASIPNLKPRRPASKKVSTTAPKKTRAPPANAVPITIYRPPSLEREEGEDDDGDTEPDPLTAPLPPAPNTINAIDVLSQVTRELVSKTASNPQLSSRSQETIELYGKELEQRMKQLGQALGTKTALEKRVRAVGGEERRLKREVKDVVSEREGVRERAEEARKLGDVDRLARLLEEIGRAVEKGWKRQKAMEES